MSKLKTHSGTKDRVRVTKTGKVLLRHAGGNHLLQHKSEARKRNYAGTQTISGKSKANLKKKLGV